MFSYIFEGMPRYEQVDSIDKMQVFANKREFKAFEWKHNPTSTRMVYIKDKITYGEWSSCAPSTVGK